MAEQLSEEAKRAIKDAFREFIYENQKTLDEMSIYKWILRGLFVLFLGGSIVGIYKFQDYLDDRIASRLAKFDNVYLASVFTTSNQYRAAIQEINAYFDKISEGDKSSASKLEGIEQDLSKISELSKSQRDFFFLTLLDAVAYIEDLGPDGEFIGKPYLAPLLKNRHFQRDFLLSKRWENDEVFNNRMANSYFRYGNSPHDIIISQNYFKLALDAAKTPTRKAANYFGLTLMALLTGDQERAAQYASLANTQRPNLITLNVILESSDFPMYDRMWRKVRQQDDFRQELEKLFEIVARQEIEKKIASRLEELRKTDSSFVQTEFLELANQMYRDLLFAFVKGDKPILFRHMNSSVYGTFVELIRRREELQQSSGISMDDVHDVTVSDVDIQGATAMISVKFVSDLIYWVEDADGNLVEGDRTAKQSSTNVWTFRRILNVSNAKWQVSNTQ